MRFRLCAVAVCWVFLLIPSTRAATYQDMDGNNFTVVGATQLTDENGNAYTYSQSGSSATITAFTYSSGTAVVPASVPISNYPVTGFGSVFSTTSITGLIIPSGITNLSGGIRISTLRTLSFPATFTTYGNDLTYQCTSLSTILLLSTNPPAGTFYGHTFDLNSGVNTTIAVPAGSLAAYQLAVATLNNDGQLYTIFNGMVPSTLVGNKAVLRVATPPSASFLASGQTFSQSVLSGGSATNAAGASVPGTFSFGEPAGVFGGGTTNAAIIFTPTDSRNFTTASTSVSVTIAPPSLTAQPAGGVVALGSATSLSVTVSGSVDGYQWMKDGGMLVGQTNSTLSLAAFGMTNSGSYQVVAANAGGIAISLPASLTLSNAPFLTWGNNSSGQLGNGLNAALSSPFSGVSNVVAAAAGGAHSLFVKSDGTLWAVGYNGYGQLGSGNLINSNVPVNVAANVVAVAAGTNHSLFVKSDGTLWAMGLNTSGQLGSGNLVNTNLPIAVASNVVSVAAGAGHSLFVKSDGTLWAMGLNTSGQLGKGNLANTNLPVAVATGVVSAAAGFGHSLFVKSDGTVWAMGLNTSGQLGNGNLINTNLPTTIGSSVAAVAAGANHSLFRKKDATLWVMGLNANGQLGMGNLIATNLPVNVASNVVAVSGGFAHSLFSKTDGTLWAMGVNASGQLGNGATLQQTNPINISCLTAGTLGGMSQATHSIAVGGYVPQVAALTNQILTAGQNLSMTLVVTNGNGPFTYQWQLGGTNLPAATNATFTLASAAPTDSGTYTATVSGLAGSSSQNVVLTVNRPGILSQPVGGVAALGSAASLGVTASGNSLSYQWMKDGGMLVGQTNSTLSFAAFGLTNSGSYQVVITNTSGMVISTPVLLSIPNAPLLSWGANTYGQLGNVITTPGNAMGVSGNNVVASTAGWNHSLFIASDGTLWAMGWNGQGQLGNGTLIDTNRPVLIASNVVAVAAGYGHSLFITSEGKLWAMGQNNYGQLGNGSQVNTNQPICVGSNVVAVAAGGYHSLIVKSDGTLWTVGQDTYSQLGDGGVGFRTSPVSVGSNVVAVAGGDIHSLFMKSDGTLWSMGMGNQGMLGLGSVASTNRPGLVATNVVLVAAGLIHSLFIDAGGTLWGMGRNQDGQLGDGTRTQRNSPIALVSNVVAVAGGNNFSMLVKSDGTLWSMGNTTVGAGLLPVQLLGVQASSIGSMNEAKHTLLVGAYSPQVVALTNQILTAGQNFSMTLVVTNGNGPFTYQWQLAGTNLPSATNATFTLSSAAPTDSGIYTATVSGLAGSVSQSATLTVNQATPVVSALPTASVLVYGQSFAASNLSGGSATNSAGVAVPGIFSFTAPTGMPNAGVTNAAVTFTPNDTTNYTAVNLIVAVTVNNQAPVVSVAPTASALTYGQAFSASGLSGGSATNAAGGSVLGTFNFTVPTGMPNAGVTNAAVTFTPIDSTNYATASIRVAVTVSKQTPGVTAPVAAIAAAQAFTPPSLGMAGAGPANPVNLATTFQMQTNAFINTLGFYACSTLIGKGETVTLYDSAHNVLASANVLLTDPQSGGYYLHSITPLLLTAGSTYTVSAFTSTNGWAGGNAGSAGTWYANPALLYINHPYAYSANVTWPNNAVYATGTSGATNQAYYGPGFTFLQVAGLIYGQTFSAVGLNGGFATNASGTSVAGTFSFNAPSGVPNAGTTNASVTFTPADTNNYNTVDVTASILVSKQTPVVSAAPVASALTQGQAFSVSILTGGSVTNAAGASVSGTFGFNAPSGVPNGGVTNAGITFTPLDSTNYTVVTSSVAVVVKQTPVVSVAPAASALTYGQALSASALTGGSATNGAGFAVPGAFSFTAPTAVPNTGVTNAALTFTPTDGATYTAASTTVSVTVNKQTPLVAAAPSASVINLGQAFSGSVLTGGTATNSAGVTVPGGFAFSAPSAVPLAGITNAAATFTPIDLTNYTTASLTVSVTVTNHTPALSAIAVNGVEDTVLAFTAANFTNAYSDVDGSSLAGITVATLPSSGALQLSGVNVTPGQVVSAANLGNLTYSPAANENGSKSFTVTASDGALSSASATVTMTIAAVNDAPVITAPQVSTLAGSGVAANVDGNGASAAFSDPEALTLDASGNVYVADTGNSAIRKITPSGAVTTMARSIYYPSSVAVDSASGTVYVGHYNNILQVTSAGVLSTFSNSGYYDGPYHIARDSSGNLYVGSTGSSPGKVLKVTPAGVVSIFTDGIYCQGIAADGSGNLYISTRNQILKVNAAGVQSAFAGSAVAGALDGAGSGASFNRPAGVAVDASGNVYVADAGNHRIRKITSAGVVSTVAGSSAGSANGTWAASTFRIPTGVAIDTAGNLYVADSGNQLIRKLSAGSNTSTLTPILEDVADAGNPGDLVADLAAGITDVDVPSVKGLAVTGVDATNGTWYYTLDGSSWNTLSGVGTNSARLLRGDDAVSRVRFVPKLHFNGTATLSYQAWDQTIGTSGGTVALNPTGGSTAYSALSGTATITVVAVNYPPTLAPIAVSGLEDTVLAFTAANFTNAYSDVESSPLGGITVVTLPASGVLQLSGVNVGSGQVVSAANLGNLTYVPATNDNGSKTFTVTASDGALYSGAATVSMTITAVNDAPGFSLPVAGGPAGVTWSQTSMTLPVGSPVVVWSGFAGNILAGPADESGQTVGFTVSNNNNALFSSQPVIAPDGTLSFTPSGGGNGTATVTVVARDNGGTANGGVDTSSAQTFAINLTRAVPVVATVPAASSLTYGQMFSASVFTGGLVTNAAGASVAGSFSFNTPSGVPNAGSTNVAVTFTPTDTGSYSTVSTTVTVAVGKGTPTITVLPAASGITFGQALSESKLSGGMASVSGSFAFTAPTTMPASGAGGQNVVFTPVDGANYTTVSLTVSVAVAVQVPVIDWSAPADITFGTVLGGTQLNASSGGVAGSFVYTPAAGTVLNAGTNQILSVQFTPADIINYSTPTAKIASITVQKANQGVTFAGPLAKDYGAEPFNPGAAASSGLAVSYVSSDPSVAVVSGGTVTVLKAGTTLLTASQSGNSNYTAAASVVQTLTVSRALPVISWAAPADMTYGAALGGTQLNASSGGVAGSFVYTPAAGTVLNAGSNQTISVQFIPSDALNYTTVVQTVSLTVQQAVQTISFGSLTAKTYGAAPFNLTAIASSSLSVSYVSSDPSVATVSGATVTVLKAGVTVITASQSGNGNYVAAVPVAQTFVVNPLLPVISWSGPADITYGTALGGVQLNAASGGVAGSFVYTPAAGVVLNAGTNQTLSAQFTPADTVNYSAPAAKTVGITVKKAAQTITLANLIKTYGDAPFSPPASAGSGLAVIYASSDTSVATVSGGVVTILKPGVTMLTASQAGNSNYTAAASVARTLTVNRALPVISWSVPGDITYGTALDGAQLNATSGGVAGSFVYAPGAGTVLSAGPGQTLRAQFVPADTVGYSTPVVSSVSLNVLKAGQSIAFAPLPERTYGVAPFALTAAADSNLEIAYSSSDPTVATVLGSVVTVLKTGTTVITASQAGNTNYNAAVSVPQTLTVNKALPVIAWINPPDIFYGTVLDGGQLNADAGGVAGSFVYTPGAGTLLNAGSNQVLSVQFTPADPVNYLAPAARAVSLNVRKAPQTITFGNLPAKTFGAAPFALLATSSSGLPVSYTSSGTSVATISGGTVTILQAGTTVITASQAGDANRAAADSVPQTLTVDLALPVITWNTPEPIIYGTALSGVQLNAGSGGVPGTFVYSPPSERVLGAGSNQTLSVEFLPSDATDYQSVRSTVGLTVVKQEPGVATLPAAESLTYGQAFGASTLSGGMATNAAGIELPGVFSFTNPAQIPNAGLTNADVTFTPVDSTNYSVTSVTVGVAVAQQVPLLATAPSAAPLTYGQALGVLALDGGQVTNAAGGGVEGTFNFNSSEFVPGVGHLTAAVSFQPSDWRNYAPAVATVDVMVAARSLVISAGNLSKVYGQNIDAAPAGYTVSGLIRGDSVTNVALGSAGAAEGAAVGAYDIVGSQAQGGGLGNYAISYVPGSLAVGPAPVRLIAGLSAESKFYDGTTAAIVRTNGVVLAGVIAADAGLVGLSTNGYVADFERATAWSSLAVRVSHLSLSGDASVNYVLEQPVIVTGAGILPRPLAVAVPPMASMLTYGQTLGAAGLEGGMATNAAGQSVEGTFGFADPESAPKAGTVAAVVTFIPSDWRNYTPAAATVEVTVAPKSLVISAGNLGKVYGQTPGLAGAGYTVSGLILGDIVTDVTMTSGGGAEGAAVGTYDIVGSQAQGGGLENYAISYQPGVLTVSAAPVRLIAGLSAESKFYDGTTTAIVRTNGVVLAGVIAADAGLVGLSTNGYVADFERATAGSSLAVRVSHLSLIGDASVNYVLEQPVIVTGAGILKLPLGVAGAPVVPAPPYGASSGAAGLGRLTPAFRVTASLTYGQSFGQAALAGGTVTNSAGDSVAGTFEFSEPNFVPPVGMVTTVVHFVPVDYQNYAPADVMVDVTVVPKSLVISVGDLSKVYGQTPGVAAAGYAVSGLIQGDSVTNVTMASDGAAEGAAVGAYDIMGSGAQGTGVENYTINYVAGTLTVNPASVRVIGGLLAESKVYDGTTTAIVRTNGVVLAGVIAADAGLVGVSTNGYVADFERATAGSSLAVRVSHLSLIGDASVNYVLEQPVIVTGAGILQRPLGVAVVPVATSLTYGQGFVAAGLVGGTATNAAGQSVEGSFEFTDPESVPGAGTVTTAVSFLPSDWQNYAVATTTVTVTVAPRDLTIMAGSLRKVYGQVLVVEPTNFTVLGLIRRDSVTNVTLAVAGSGGILPVGTYYIMGSNAQGTGVENYTIHYVSGTLTVSAAPLRVSGGLLAQSKFYDGTTAATILSNGVVLAGLIDADTNRVGVSTHGYVADFERATAWSSLLVNVTHLTLTGESSTNYVLEQPLSLTGAGILPGPVGVAAGPVASELTYGDPFRAASLAGGVVTNLAGLSVDGSFSFATPDGVAQPGLNTVPVLFTPADGVDYATVSTTAGIMVNQQTASIRFDGLARTYTGNALPVSVVTEPVNVPVSVTYNGSSAEPTNAGVYTVVALITGSTFSGGSTNTLVVGQAGPRLAALPTASALSYGQTFGDVVLSGGSATNLSGFVVPGIFHLTTPSGMPRVGTTNASITFIPTDSTNYATVSATVVVGVSPSTPVILWNTPADMAYGMPLGGAQLNATSGGVAGSFVYTPAEGTVLSLGGGQVVSVQFTPTDTLGYTTPAPKTVTLNVVKAGQTISFGPLAARTYGDAPFSLGATVNSGLALSYASSDPSVVAMSEGTVTILKPGTTVLTVSQSGDSNYFAAGPVQQTLTVNRAASGLVLGSGNNPGGYHDAVSFTATLPADATGQVVFTSGQGPISTNLITQGLAVTASLITLPRGPNTITASYRGDANYLGSTNTLTQVVTNHLPMAGVLTVTRTAGQTIKVALSQLAALWTDADGDTITLTGMVVTSTNHLILQTISWTNGVAIAANAANLAYAYIGYPNGANANDQFTYTLSDGYGGTAVGTVQIVTSSSPLFGQVSSLSPLAGHPDLVFLGHPGYSYRVQRTTSVSPANWVSIWTTNAPASGLFHYTDNFGDLGGNPPGAAYYRLSWTP